MNVLVQGSANMKLDKNNNIVTKNKYLLNNQGDYVFKIGHQKGTCCTEQAGFYFKDDIYFMDLPGLDDQEMNR